MGRRRLDRTLPADVSPICLRMVWLLEHVWYNNVTQMARDLDVSQTALSRVLAGQMPSGKMLEGLGSRVDINLRWLLTGQGEPLAQPGRSIGGVCWPLVTRLLPGEPHDFPELLGHMTLPAASPFLLESAYWYQVAADAPIVVDKTSGVDVGDYLLIEASARWRRLEVYRGRLVVLRSGNGNEAILAKVALHEDPVELPELQYELHRFGVSDKAHLLPDLSRETAAPKVRSTKSKEAGTRFYADDVIGVVLQLTRILERSRW